MEDRDYMLRAIELAKKGAGATNPNPMVGAVIVKDGRIIGEGYHRKYGELHAERNALADCRESAEGATIYVTLEPCCHYGKTPPCTEAIMEHKLKRVVIGSRDPNPKVAGKGAKMLQEAGIEVVQDFMREECDEINPVFFHYITKKTPFVALKYAMTADGKIATKTGDSQWITGETARKHVHILRNYYMGILVGINTVLADDPMLNVRLNSEETTYRNPVRIVCDTRLQIPLTSQLVNTAKEIKTIVATSLEETENQKVKALEEKGVTVLFLPKKNQHVDLQQLLIKVGELGIDGILVEGGGTVSGAFLDEKLVNRVYVYIGAKVFGGNSSYTPVKGDGAEKVNEALVLEKPKIMEFDEDVLLQYDVRG
ncbi:MAG: bifunctional diaminohydroxyphosphoribosylaminopyrimidine deaminase/5-amino-6-(5-phosphoribosylamino)uracil reductase RibD [Lachnospiraceae bacterium]|nr:bifunctional diaminohydroxyphosphoribosylaminopyrimidine deaminase/5-amino-6-(5-phosphoribosylamino)uracil reductase RibD [Lachnospiraceae bacterium]